MFGFQLFLLFLCFFLFVSYVYLRYTVECLKKKNERNMIPARTPPPQKKVIPVQGKQVSLICPPIEDDDEDDDYLPCPLTSRITPVENMRR
jgi:hypothetical protein